MTHMTSSHSRSKMALFDLLRAGEIDPPEAERRATGLGIGPLRALPPKELFAPEKQPHWTIPMTIEWICWRSLDRVRDLYDDYRTMIFDWRHSSEEQVNAIGEIETCAFWEPIYREPASYVLLGMREALTLPDDPSELGRIMSYKMAREELWRVCSTESIRVLAISQLTAKPVSIPVHEWPYLQLVNNDGKDCLVHHGEVGTFSYASVLFNTRDVMREWREIATEGRGKKKSFEEFLRQKISASPDKPTMTKGEATLIGTEDYALSKSECKRVWTSTIESLEASDWARPGRRKRKSIG